MFNETIYPGLVSVVPYWSHNILKFYGLGNEYNIISNIIITEILKITTPLITIKIIIIIILIFILLTILYYSGIGINLHFFEKHSIIIKHDSNIYCDKVSALNNYLLKNKDIKNIIYNTITNDYYIDTLKDYKIDNDIFLTITRNNNNAIYNLYSYKKSPTIFLNKILNNNFSELVLVGSEDSNKISYPETINAINKLLINVCKITNLKYVNDRYIINNINNYNCDNINISITRNNNIVYYYLKSNEICCKKWINDLIIRFEYKYKVILSALQNHDDCGHSSNYKSIEFNPLMMAIDWYVINKLNINNYEIVEINKEHNYILNPVSSLKLEDDLYLTIKKESIINIKDNKPIEINHYQTIITYELYSSSKDINNRLKEYEQEYNDSKNTNVLQHFILYKEKNKNGCYVMKYINYILMDNKKSKTFESFNTIFHEHVDRIKRDIVRFNDIDYFQKRGLKRKISYLFHGKPGCGKTSTIIAMALETNRHIIQVSLNQIPTIKELYKILNYKTLADTDVDKKAIFVFDEIDFCVEESCKESNNIKENSSKIIINTNTQEKVNEDEKITINDLLSCLDGIANMNGVIIVATTNNIDKLPSSLYRELRLTPIEFNYLRVEDCIKIIELYFGDIQNESLLSILKDNILQPVKLIDLCQKNEHLSINEFIDILKPLFN